MTPEQAQELLRIAADGPWEERPSENCDCCHDVVSKDGVVVALASHNCDAPLVAAAPDLAETVAGLRYEYAVEIKHGDGWITSRHHTPTIETAKEIAARYKRTDTRIVRRLATQPEVVE